MSETTLTAEQRAEWRQNAERGWPLMLPNETLALLDALDAAEADADDYEQRIIDLKYSGNGVASERDALLADNAALQARVKLLEAVARALTDDCEEDDEEPWVLVARTAWLALRAALEASNDR